jgi:alkylation response protein AidB-like acyl-CoA dehydrogenase
MDLADATADRAFRATLREFLEQSLAETRALPSDPAAAVEQSRAWQRKLYAAGYVGLAGPRAYGASAHRR